MLKYDASSCTTKMLISVWQHLMGCTIHLCLHGRVCKHREIQVTSDTSLWQNRISRMCTRGELSERQKNAIHSPTFVCIESLRTRSHARVRTVKLHCCDCVSVSLCFCVSVCACVCVCVSVTVSSMYNSPSQPHHCLLCSMEIDHKLRGNRDCKWQHGALWTKSHSAETTTGHRLTKTPSGGSDRTCCSLWVVCQTPTNVWHACNGHDFATNTH